jgi:hypothetical protein
MSEQISGQPSHPVDPAISDAVHGVSNRFGVQGLEVLIEVATDELERARTALEELSSEE